MKINTKDTVTDIQAKFQETYPYLNLKFYVVKHDHNTGSSSKDEVSDQAALLDLNSKLTNGNINIDKNLTVDELESDFENNYGLHVQVFRKSGDIWLQTSVTDHWTLKKHTNHAIDSEKTQNV